MSRKQDVPVVITWQQVALCVIIVCLAFVGFDYACRKNDASNKSIPVMAGNKIQPRAVWASPSYRVHTFVSTTQSAGEGKLYLQLANGTRYKQLLVNGRLAVRFGPSQYGLISNGHLVVDVPNDAQRGDRVVLELTVLDDLHSPKVLEVQNYLLAVIR